VVGALIFGQSGEKLADGCRETVSTVRARSAASQLSSHARRKSSKRLLNIGAAKAIRAFLV
jgi:hypothetical protein